jgi:hypothetical protein
MDGKKKVMAPSSQDFYSSPYFTELDRLLYRLQFQDYCREVNDVISFVQGLQSSVLHE